MDEEPSQIAPTNEDFEAMKAAAGLNFDEAARSAIVNLLRDFEQDCRLAALSKRRVELDGDIHKVSMRVQKVQQKHGPFWQQSAAGKSDLSAKLRAGERLQVLAGEVRGRGMPPEYVPVWKLLFGLEEIFKKAGGKSTGIHRGDRRVRGGPFPKFANAAVRCLPKSIRPKGITSNWEEIYSQRRRGHASLIRMPAPEGFSLTYTSRRPRPR
jgi:hypothetical protein